MILSKMAIRCWMKSGSAGSYKKKRISSAFIVVADVGEYVKSAVPQVRPCRRQPSSPWAASQVAKAGSGRARPLPPLGHQLSRKTLLVTLSFLVLRQGKRKRKLAVWPLCLMEGQENTLSTTLSFRREVGLTHRKFARQRYSGRSSESWAGVF